MAEIKESSVVAEILNNASFGDKKNMNLPGTSYLAACVCMYVCMYV